jgi:hypothetical protein
METALAPTPATLASATSIDDPVIDPALHDNPAYTEPHTAIAQEDLDAATAEIINASIRTAAQAHAAAEAAEAVVAEAVAEAEADLATQTARMQTPHPHPRTRVSTPTSGLSGTSLRRIRSSRHTSPRRTLKSGWRRRVAGAIMCREGLPTRRREQRSGQGRGTRRLTRSLPVSCPHHTLA